MQSTLTKVERYVSALPPELAGRSIAAAAQGNVTAFAVKNLASAAWGCVFLFVFSRRMGTEYRGENLSDPANVVRAAKAPKQVVTHTTPVAAFVEASARPADVTRVVEPRSCCICGAIRGCSTG